MTVMIELINIYNLSIHLKCKFYKYISTNSDLQAIQIVAVIHQTAQPEHSFIS